MRTILVLTVVLLVMSLWPRGAIAQATTQINYQGKLTDSTGVAVADGTYNMRFWLLQNTGQATSAAIWTEELTGSNRVDVVNGLFSVMLGSTTDDLDTVDFSQALYLGVEIGGTGGSPSWDGEMLPRKPLGTVPAAFEAYSLGGVASSSFLRSDAADTLTATEASTLLTINQSGTGDILNLLDGGTEVFTVIDGGNIGIGTTTPTSKLTVAGDIYATGNVDIASTSVYQIGGVDMLQLYADQFGNYSNVFIRAEGSTLDPSNSARNVAVGRRSLDALADGDGNTALGNTVLTNVDNSSDNTGVGDSALDVLVSGFRNVAVGEDAGGALIDGQDNVFIGAKVGTNLATSTDSVIIGSRAAGFNGGDFEANELTILGFQAGANIATSSDANILIGYRAANSLTTGANNLIIGYDVEAPSNTASGQLNIGNIIFGTSIDEVGTTISDGNIGIGTSTPNYRLSVAGDFGLTGALYDNAYTAGTNGQVLQTTGSGVQWVATSTLGFSSQTLALGADNQIPFVNAGGTDLEYSDNFTFDGVDLNLSTTSAYQLGGVDIARVYASQFFGFSNLYFGSEAPNSSSTVTFSNLAVGRLALTNNEIGSNNTAIGDRALRDSTSASGNTSVGVQALQAALDGANTAVGFNAGRTLVSGADNVFIGQSSGTNISTSSNSVLLGSEIASASPVDTELNNLVVIGLRAGHRLETGADNNIIIGQRAADSLTTGANNLIIGYDVEAPSNTADGQLNIGNIIFGTSIDETGTTISDGNIGIGTSSPASKLDVWGDFRVGTSGTPTLFTDVSTNRVGIGTISPLGTLTVSGPDAPDLIIQENGNDAGSYLRIYDGSDSSAFISKTNNTAGGATLSLDAQVSDGTSNAYVRMFRETNTTGAKGIQVFDGDGTAGLSALIGAGSTDTYFAASGGSVGIGTTSPGSLLSLDARTFSGAGVVGLDQYLETENTVDAAVQFGNRFFLNASNTATTTIVGSIYRVADDTTFGNTVRGLEVQANQGSNTQGENTALSGFARTFGVRGVTSGDAGGSFEPAGGFFETEGTTQGNAIRGFSSSITTASLLSLFQDTSDFTGTGLEMNFGNTTGDFSSTSSKYLDFQNGGTSVFTVSAFGTTTIGDGTTNNMAGLQIGYGGICVDNDGVCTASTTGRITAVESQTGNSDLAEMYFSDQDLEPGELVVLRSELSVRRATPDADLPVLGVVSTKPGLTLGFDDRSTRPGETGYPLALSGRVPVRLSNENGPIAAGDSLMLSSLPGIAMKSDGTGTVVGIALEDFDERRMYSDTYINQFGDDIAEPDYTPVTVNTDPRINDGCYYSGGGAVDGEPCVPLQTETVDEQVIEANELAAAEAIEDALQKLQYVDTDTYYLDNGEAVQVGQVVMFVDRTPQLLTSEQRDLLTGLLATSTIDQQDGDEVETVMDRLLTLADSFVAGVLSVFELRADRVETNELCVDGVCVTADDVRRLLDVAAEEITAPEATAEPETDQPEDESVSAEEPYLDEEEAVDQSVSSGSTSVVATTSDTLLEAETTTSSTTPTTDTVASTTVSVDTENIEPDDVDTVSSNEEPVISSESEISLEEEVFSDTEAGSDVDLDEEATQMIADEQTTEVAAVEPVVESPVNSDDE